MYGRNHFCASSLERNVTQSIWFPWLVRRTSRRMKRESTERDHYRLQKSAPRPGGGSWCSGIQEDRFRSICSTTGSNIVSACHKMGPNRNALRANDNSLHQRKPIGRSNQQRSCIQRCEKYEDSHKSYWIGGRVSHLSTAASAAICVARNVRHLWVGKHFGSESDFVDMTVSNRAR